MFKRFTNFSLKMFTKLFPSEKPLLLTGVGSAARLAALARASGSQRPLLVTEKALLELGLLDVVIEQFESEGCNVAVFDGIVPNPTFQVIEDGVRVCREHDCDSIFAIGGGSAIDAAKVIAACASNAADVRKLVGVLKVKRPPLPFYVVPTTSGTGSEATNAAVISDTKTHQKKFVVDPKLIPTAAALDASMLKSLPPHITAATGMDALTHALEAFVSRNRFGDAERDAKLAVKLLLERLPEAYQDGSNLEARELVALASFLAGNAFNKSGLGYVHAISHQISARYDTPHGLANAVILPRVLRFNQPASSDRLADLERTVAGEQGGTDEEMADRFITRVDALCRLLSIPSSLNGLTDKDFDGIARGALEEARSLYAVPRLMNHAQCVNILAAVSQRAALASHGTGRGTTSHAARHSAATTA